MNNSMEQSANVLLASSASTKHRVVKPYLILGQKESYQKYVSVKMAHDFVIVKVPSWSCISSISRC